MSQYKNTRSSDPLESSGAIQLDFTAMPIWWRNGNAALVPDVLDPADREKLKEKLGVAYFGGWYIQIDKGDPVLNDLGLPLIPGFVKMNFTNDKNVSYPVYACRTLTICPLLKRIGWFTNENTGKAYSATQVVALAATPNMQTKKFDVWAPVVLKANSLSGKAIIDSLAAWRRQIEPLLPEGSNPPWAHWVTLGTVRKEIYVVQRGKGNATSPATPCEVFIPQKDLKDFVAGRYIGDTTRELCEQYRSIASDWAASWNDRTQTTPTTDDAGETQEPGAPGPARGNKNTPQPPDNFGDDIPF